MRSVDDARARVVRARFTVSLVYTARVRVCHGDLDAFGRAHASAYLRHLAQVAIDASTAAGFDAAWYEAAGARWLIRRTTFAVARPARADASLSVRTWVEDFRRVRSRRRYEVSGGDVPALTAEYRLGVRRPRDGSSASRAARDGIALRGIRRGRGAAATLARTAGTARRPAVPCTACGGSSSTRSAT